MKLTKKVDDGQGTDSPSYTHSRDGGTNAKAPWRGQASTAASTAASTPTKYFVMPTVRMFGTRQREIKQSRLLLYPTVRP